jgi:hypothetical protein
MTTPDARLLRYAISARGAQLMTLALDGAARGAVVTLLVEPGGRAATVLEAGAGTPARALVARTLASSARAAGRTRAPSSLITLWDRLTRTNIRRVACTYY